jgi:hypothetical protein
VTRRLTRRLMGVGGLLLAVCARPADAVALSCTEAAAMAEAGAGIPPGLLLAIGNVESGRTDEVGKRSPWPWTINTGGAGRFFATAEEAVLAVETLRAGGVQSIDIGCFQINLFHHPDAFPDLVSSFNPLTNALAAARFLLSLHEEFGAWEPAIAAYHSRVDMLGAPYRDRVLGFWHGTPVAGRITLAGVHVWGPAGEVGFGAGLSSWTAWPKFAGAPPLRLPHVVTASAR